MIAREDEVVQFGQENDVVSFLGDQEQDERDEDGETRNEKGRNKGLDDLLFQRMSRQVVTLQRKVRGQKRKVV